MQKKLKLSRTIILFLVMLFILTLIPVYAAAVDVIKDAKQFEDFTDSFMKSAMNKYHVPGVTLVVIKDGKVFFKKGYGYSDVDKKILVDPDRTIFRAGSISKLITTTAVMQLVEQRKIDLNNDINLYIKDFKIKSDYKKPVTMANLLTHTGGFDESVIGIANKDLSDIQPLGEYLKNHMPPVIREPGTVIQYSNYGLALAGYIIEKVSGVQFEKYVEQNILNPLDMNNSSFTINNGMLSNISKGYKYKSEKYTPVGLYSLNIPPAGSFSTTADDMSRFLIAHLKNGKYSDKRIFSDDTAVFMRKQHFSIYAGMPGYTYGFYEKLRNGIIAIEHKGTLSPYHSLVSLIPDENAGFFISTNSEDGPKLFDDYANDFYKLLKPSKKATPAVSKSDYKVDITILNGIYTGTKRSRTNLLKFISLFSSSTDLNIKANDKNELILDNGKNKQTYVRIDDYLFQNTIDNSYLAFKKDGEGKIYASSSTDSVVTYEKITPFEKSSMYSKFLIMSFISFLIVCIFWLIGTVKKVKNKYTGLSGLARLISNITCLLNMIFILGFLLYLTTNSSLSVTLYLKFILCIPIITTILTTFMVILTIFIWKRGLWKIAGRIYYTVITIATLIFVIVLNYGNAIGFKF